MGRIHITAVTTAVIVACLLSPGQRAQGHSPPKLDNLMRARLERVADTEVIVSRVTLAPGTALPKHWHPGEEFAYILAGSVTLRPEGQAPVVLHAREVGRVPLAKVHSAQAGPEGTEILVFRVHQAGKPERVLVH